MRPEDYENARVNGCGGSAAPLVPIEKRIEYLKQDAEVHEDAARYSCEAAAKLMRELEAEQERQARESWVRPGVIVQGVRGGIYGTVHRYIIADLAVTKGVCMHRGYTLPTDKGERYSLICLTTGASTTTERSGIASHFEPVQLWTREGPRA